MFSACLFVFIFGVLNSSSYFHSNIPEFTSKNWQDTAKSHSEKALSALDVVTDLSFSKPIPTPYTPLCPFLPKPFVLLSNVNCHKIQAIIKVTLPPQTAFFSSPLPLEVPWHPHILVRSTRSNHLVKQPITLLGGSMDTWRLQCASNTPK